MSFGLSAAAIGGIAAGAGAIGSAAIASNASGKAADAQAASAAMSTEEQRRQADQLQRLLGPYTRAGTGGNEFDGAAYLAANPDVAANEYFRMHPEEHYNTYGKNEGRPNPTKGGPMGSLQAQQDLLGLNGNAAQGNAVKGVQNGASFQAQLAAGENSIRQNASATGGLRGGNTQAALAQFSPQLLAQALQQQYMNLGGLTQLGQNSATNTAMAGQNTANAITGINTQLGASNAGNALAQGTAFSNGINGLTSAFTGYAGARGF